MKDMARMKKKEWPLTKELRGSKVTIYRVPDRGGRWLYQNHWKDGTERKRKSFSDPEEAKGDADIVLVALTNAEVIAESISNDDRQVFASAKAAIQRFGISLDVVAREYAAARDILGEVSLVQAARHYKATARDEIPEMSVAEALKQYKESMTAREAGGGRVGTNHHYRGICGRLGRFADAFSMGIGEVTAEAVEQWIGGLRDERTKRPISNVTKNGYQRYISGLFSFAKKRGWLPAHQETAAKSVETFREKAREIQIFSPMEMEALINAADTEFLPFVALIAFGGIRREELFKGLRWEDIDFADGSIQVAAEIAKNGKKRKITMPANLRVILGSYKHQTGPIFKIDPRKRMAKLSRDSKVPWKRNALRHSFGSYRTEQTRNFGQVAMEMGNTPGVVQAHYHEFVKSKEAATYWAIGLPKKRGGVRKKRAPRAEGRKLTQ